MQEAWGPHTDDRLQPMPEQREHSWPWLELVFWAAAALALIATCALIVFGYPR